MLMRKFCFFAMVICFALAGQARGVDLAKIDRTLRKEPIYRSKRPQYCLLVFGTEAKTRVWVVLDGDVLYLDRAYLPGHTYRVTYLPGQNCLLPPTRCDSTLRRKRVGAESRNRSGPFSLPDPFSLPY